MEYGVGVAYRVTQKVSIFAEYIRVYNHKGFDGRSKADKLRAGNATIGIIYHF